MATSLFNLGRAYLRARRPEEAMGRLVQALELAPKVAAWDIESGVHRQLALAYLDTDDFDSSARHAESGVTLGQHANYFQPCAEALCGRGRVRQACGQIEAALADLDSSAVILRQADNSGSPQARTRLRLAFTLLHLGELWREIRAIGIAISVDPHQGEIIGYASEPGEGAEHLLSAIGESQATPNSELLIAETREILSTYSAVDVAETTPVLA